MEWGAPYERWGLSPWNGMDSARDHDLRPRMLRIQMAQRRRRLVETKRLHEECYRTHPDRTRASTQCSRTFVLATIAVPTVIYGLSPHLHRLKVRLLSA